MQAMGWYILSAGLAALLVSIVKSFSDSKSGTGILIRMICGLFMAFVLIKPLKNLDLDRFVNFTEVYAGDATAAVNYGRELASDWNREHIKAEAEAYILDKAQSLGCDIQVQITVSDDETPIPVSVVITGTVEPHIRRELEAIIENDLGIHKEQQQWIGAK